jgi:transcriptional antiterminator RfaH
MPLLEAEPCLYPDTLFADPTHAGSEDGRWWVLYTKARMEKSLARKLRGKGVSFYLPLYHQSWKANGRMRSSYLPLFPGYVFLFGDDSARVAALETNLLCSTLPVPDQRKLYDDLARVDRLLGGSVPVSPEDGMNPGTPVEVTAGTFQGLTGKIIRRGDRSRFVVEVDFLRRGVSIEADGWALRPLIEPTSAKAG